MNKMSLNSVDIQHIILSSFSGIQMVEAWGEKSFFYNPNGIFTRGTYFATIKEKNSENGRESDLDRDGVFRFNFGIEKKTFLELFSDVPKRPSKGKIIAGDYDFKKIDQLNPHPVYGWMCWVAILNPSEKSFVSLKPLLVESYNSVLQKHEKKISSQIRRRP